MEFLIEEEEEKQPLYYYLSGPMSGLAEFNKPAFDSAAKDLRSKGLTVINPAETGVGEEWADFLRKDIRDLMDCDIIIVLDGWSKSRGARLEVHIGKELGMPILTYPDLKDLREANEWDQNPLDLANKLVDEDRQSIYGHPAENYSNIAKLWSPIFKISVTAWQACICMMLVKISRLCNTPDHFDSIVDIGGYNKCLWMIHKREKELLKNEKQT